MNIFTNKIKYSSIIFMMLFSINCFAKTGLLKPSDSSLSKSTVLNVRTGGYAGIIPYIRDAKGKTYILMGREAGGRSKGEYCAFGGKVDPNPATGMPYRLISTAKDELRQESVKQFNLSEKYIVKNSYFYYDLKKINSSLFGLTKLNSSNYHSSGFMNKTRQQSIQKGVSWKYVEKDDFQWVAISSLASAIAHNQTKNIQVDVLPSHIRHPWAIDTAPITKKMTINVRRIFLTGISGLREPLKKMSATCRHVIP